MQCRLYTLSACFLSCCLLAVLLTATPLRPQVLVTHAQQLLVNLAMGHVAAQSSTASGAPWADASRAVDGNNDGNFNNGSVTHTEYENQPWWQVDLGASFSLDHVTVWNRTDCCSDRLTGFYVLVSDQPFGSGDLATTLYQPGVSSYYTPGQAGTPTSISVGRSGRYVRVQLAGVNFFSLAEVEVYGLGANPADEESTDQHTVMNVAASANGGTATASSTYSRDYPVSSIINGDRKGIGWGSVTGGWNDATLGQSPDSVEVQFVGLMTIGEVDVVTLQDNIGGDQVWVEDNLPAGAISAGDSEGWNWIGSNPPPLSGSLSHQSNLATGMHQHYFYGATNRLPVAAGDKLFTYVYLDPSSPPSEIMLQWYDGTWEHRAYWGNNQIAWGGDNSEARHPMGGLPTTGQWVRLEVPASLVNLEGHTISGMAFTLFGGRASWDHAGRTSASNLVEPTIYTTFNNYGIRNFNVSYRGVDGQWYSLASVVGNNNVLRQFKFSPVITDRIRVDVLNSVDYSRIVEVEAWGTQAYIPPGEKSARTPSTPENPSLCDNKNNSIRPCELSRNLLAAIREKIASTKPYSTNPLPYRTDAQYPYYRNANWTSELDWTYRKGWDRGGSVNKPQLAHALALWRDPSEYAFTFPTGYNTTDAALKWWTTYFDCQTHDATCTAPAPQAQYLQYWGGTELFSNTYDYESLSAVVATLYWATEQLRTLTPGSDRYNTVVGLANQARRYLRLTWSLYALGAGKGPALTSLDRFNHKDGPDGFDNLKDQICDGNYTGPFIPLAGMRSDSEHNCKTDYRSQLLARALGWTYKGPHEDDDVNDLFTQIERLPRDQTAFPTENPYALDAGFQGVLRRHIDGTLKLGEDTTTLIFNFLQKIRTGVVYHFIGATVNGVAGQEARMTLMEDNLNLNTTPTFAVTYDYNLKIARSLFPWTNHLENPWSPQNPDGCRASSPGKPWRDIETFGWAQLNVPEDAPASVFATSVSRDRTQACKNYEGGLPVTEMFNLPTTWRWKYHIVFGPSNAPMMVKP